MVLHDETGTLSFAGNPESLAWAILKTLRDPARAERLKEKARERLREEFDWSLLADKTMAVYDRVWSEFLESYWIEGTVWPVSPGAHERAEELKLREKAEQGLPVVRPRPRITLEESLVRHVEETLSDEYPLEEDEAVS